MMSKRQLMSIFAKMRSIARAALVRALLCSRASSGKLAGNRNTTGLMFLSSRIRASASVALASTVSPTWNASSICFRFVELVTIASHGHVSTAAGKPSRTAFCPT